MRHWFLLLSGLDYVSHEDILPYNSTEQAPIQHELFERFLMYNPAKCKHAYNVSSPAFNTALHTKEKFISTYNALILSISQHILLCSTFIFTTVDVSLWWLCTLMVYILSSSILDQ